jgi:hypothetical protein
MTGGKPPGMRDLLPEERNVGEEPADVQTDLILQESERRTLDRNAAPSSRVEHRTSEETTPPA